MPVCIQDFVELILHYAVAESNNYILQPTEKWLCVTGSADS